MDKDDEIYSEQIYGYTEIDNVEPLYVTDHSRTILTWEMLVTAWHRLNDPTDLEDMVEPSLQLTWPLVHRLLMESARYGDLMSLPWYKRVWAVLRKAS